MMECCRCYNEIHKFRRLWPVFVVANKGPEPAPPRITSNVKQNLQFLKMWKACSDNSWYLVYSSSVFSNSRSLPFLRNTRSEPLVILSQRLATAGRGRRRRNSPRTSTSTVILPSPSTSNIPPRYLALIRSLVLVRAKFVLQYESRFGRCSSCPACGRL